MEKFHECKILKVFIFVETISDVKVSKPLIWIVVMRNQKPDAEYMFFLVPSIAVFNYYYCFKLGSTSHSEYWMETIFS